MTRLSSITLLESRNLLAAGGTTGLRTWEACLHLASFLSSSKCPISVKHKRVVELGAGTGLLSILCAKSLSASQVLATDGSREVVDDMVTNFALNDLQDCPRIGSEELCWGNDLTQAYEADLILGADITYDSSSMAALVQTLEQLIKLNPKAEIVISATIRNEDTFASFITSCEAQGFSVTDLGFEVPKPHMQTGPFYSNLVPIRICLIGKT